MHNESKKTTTSQKSLASTIWTVRVNFGFCSFFDASQNREAIAMIM